MNIDYTKSKFLNKFDISQIQKNPAGICLTIIDKCNKKCTFCPRSNKQYVNSKQPEIEIDLILKICNDLGNKYNGYISLGGFGEPTLHNNFCKIVSIILEKMPLCNLIVLTNGTNLDKIEKLKINNNLTIQISIEKTYLNENNCFANKISKIKNNVILKIIDNEFISKFFYNRGGNVNVNSNIINDKCCNLPFYKCSIDNNGNVLLCDSDWYRMQIIGNVYNEPLSSIWNSDKLNKIRKELLNNNRILLCKKCNCNGKINGENFVEQWRKILC